MTRSIPSNSAKIARTSSTESTTGSRLGRFARSRVDIGQLDLQNLLVEKQNRRKRLRLRAGRHVPLDRQMREKLFDLAGVHLAQVALAVKQDEPLDPVDIRFFGALGVMEQPHLRGHLVEQFRRAAAGAKRGRYHRKLPCQADCDFVKIPTVGTCRLAERVPDAPPLEHAQSVLDRIFSELGRINSV